jgi:hypothetical protein
VISALNGISLETPRAQGEVPVRTTAAYGDGSAVFFPVEHYGLIENRARKQ